MMRTNPRPLLSRFIASTSSSLSHRCAVRRIAPRASPILLRSLTAAAATSRPPASERHLIINAVGLDRPGIVSDITKLITDAGGNVGDSRAAKLGSHFGLMMHVSVPSDGTDDLREALGEMGDLNASCVDVDDPSGVEVTPSIAYTGRFTLTGADNPGIVHSLTVILARHGLSIDEMRTSREVAPFGGSTLFSVSGVVNAPEPLASHFDAGAVRDELMEMGERMNCDVDLVEVTGEEEDAYVVD